MPECERVGHHLGVMQPILPGAEPFSAIGGPDGVLVLHGFTGSPHEMRGVAEQLADAGFTVDLPLLPGHGTDISDLVPLRWADWARAAEDAYLDLSARCRQVVVFGLSMGGALACRLASSHPEIVGLVLVNPFVEAPDAELRGALEELQRSGTEVLTATDTDIADDSVRVVSYGAMAVAPTLSLFDGVEEIAGLLHEVRCPVLLFSSRNDHVLPSSNGDLLEAKVGGRLERVWCERSFHVATLDFDRDEIEARTVTFVTSVVGEMDE